MYNLDIASPKIKYLRNAYNHVRMLLISVINLTSAISIDIKYVN